MKDKRKKRHFVETREHYDLLVREGDDPVKDPPALREYMERWDGEAFFAALHLNNTEEVLEVGVGTGRLAVRVAPDCKRFTGIDLSPEAIGRAKNNLAHLQNVSLVCGNFLSYDFHHKYDMIYSSLTFLHIREKKKAIGKVAQLLKENGRFILSIDTSRQKFLDCGERSLRLYPDSPQKTEKYLRVATFSLIEKIQTEAACIFVVKKASR